MVTLWSILGDVDTFEAAQATARGDYIEHSLRRQYNQRSRY